MDHTFKFNTVYIPRLSAEIITALILALVLAAAGMGVWVPNFYGAGMAQEDINRLIISDIAALVCVPLVLFSMILSQRKKMNARLIWAGLLIYLGYSYAIYTFNPIDSPIYFLYVVILCLCSVGVVITLLSAE